MHVPIPQLGHVIMQKNSENVKVIVYRLKKSMRIEKGSGVFGGGGGGALCHGMPVERKKNVELV